MNDILKELEAIETERKAILDAAKTYQDEMNNKLETLKAREHAACGTCEGEKISVLTLARLAAKVAGK